MEPWEDGVGEWEGHSVTQVFIPIFKAPQLLGLSNRTAHSECLWRDISSVSAHGLVEPSGGPEAHAMGGRTHCFLRY